MVKRYTLESLAAATGMPSMAEAVAGGPMAIPMVSVSAGMETDGVAAVLPAPPAVAAVAAQPGVETEEPALSLGVTNGVAAVLGEEEIYAGVTAPMAIPTAFPLVAGVATMSLAMFKWLMAKFGMKILITIIGATAVANFLRLMGMGASDDTVLPIKPGEKRRKRYSIGANPRVGTLAKVSRHCMRHLKRHRKIIDEFLPPRRKALPATALARTYLSTAERKALKA